MRKNNKVFISGGAGVIGKEAVRILEKQDVEIFVGDLKERPDEFSSSLKYRHGDLNTLSLDELRSFQPNIFIHLAATFERSVETYEFWDQNFIHNVKLSNHLLSLIKEEAYLTQIIFASSYLVYDPKLYMNHLAESATCFLSETHELNARNLIGAAKLYHESELHFFEKNSKVPRNISILRIFRGYGKGSRDVISRWVRSLLRDEPIEVFNIENTFDFINAQDTANAIVSLVQKPQSSGIFNIGTGESRSILDILRILKEYFPNMKIRYLNNSEMYECSAANVARIRDLTGWTAQTKLEDGIKKIIEYEKNYL